MVPELKLTKIYAGMVGVKNVANLRQDKNKKIIITCLIRTLNKPKTIINKSFFFLQTIQYQMSMSQVSHDKQSQQSFHSKRKTDNLKSDQEHF